MPSIDNEVGAVITEAVDKVHPVHLSKGDEADFDSAIEDINELTDDLIELIVATRATQEA
jgi:hypothetical protein